MNARPLMTELRGNLLLDEPMSKHTSWRIGGPADRYYQPADIVDLSLFLSQLPENEPVYWLGLGSNLLVRDGGIRGTVIATSGVVDGLEQIDEKTVRAEAGVACAKVARFCARAGLSGAEFLAGIPGTMGGALAMNAGAFGGETWEVITAVETLDQQGQCQHRQPEDFEIAYRHVTGPKGEWFVAAQLQLEPGGEPEALQARIKALLAKRGDSQPTSLPNAGSVFRNPEGDFAARLIEACGLKGQCEGAACVSDKHANFIINTGGATAYDVETLIERIMQEVEEKQAVQLQREIHIVGEAA
ncbi:MAG: UDP-N-acetylmuramate dehydrogenase [Gammaproteobacteria bacterium]|nr:UDP-N-acetylmuramate dehydrogenase [Gammaproteobacteria bacterium]MCF6259129.1 UDP-N-acetylmuramate dehydrogenase [Gammaproteobacteria bacterium]